MNSSNNLVQTQLQKIQAFDVLVWPLIPSGYAIVTNCLSLCNPAHCGSRPWNYFRCQCLRWLLTLRTLTSVFLFSISILTRTRMLTLVKTCSC